MFKAIGTSLRAVFYTAAALCSSVTLVNQWQIAHHQIQSDQFHPIVTPTIGTMISPYYTYVSWDRAHGPIKYDFGDPGPVTSVAEHTPDSWQTEGQWSLTILGAPGAAIGNLGGSLTGYLGRDHEWQPQPRR